MDTDSLFENSRTPSGEFIRANGRVYVNGKLEVTDYYAFLPDELPPRSQIYTDAVVSTLASTTLVLGELRATAGRMSPFIISGIAKAALTKEAQLSSKIEGTIVLVEDLLLFESAHPKSDPSDIREVRNFMDAQTIAIEQIKSGRPLSQHLLKSTHEILLEGVRGAQWHPGEYRTAQNMIGTRRDVLSARFVPPPAELMAPLLDNLFTFINQHVDIDHLIKIALAHYQFEAIHPFEDGNGRLGRLLIILMLICNGILEEPIIYPSSYFELNQDEYREHLLMVSKNGDWSSWLSFFLAGIKDACQVAIHRCEQFSQLILDAKEKVKQPQSPQMLCDLIELFAYEFSMTVKRAAVLMEIDTQLARIYFRRLEEAGIIARVPGKTRNVVYYLRGVWQIIES